MRTVARRLPMAAWVSLAAALAAALILTSAVAAVSARAAEGCSNEQLRKEDNSTALPDCRAYELVSPTNKGEGEVNFGGEQAAPDGEAITWGSFASFAGNPSNPTENQYLSVRGAGGWQTAGVSPPKAVAYVSDIKSFGLGFERNLSRMVFMTVTGPGAYNLVLRNPVGEFEPLSDVTALPPGSKEFPRSVTFYGASPDYSHVLLESTTPLLAGAPERALYEWGTTGLQIVSVLPGGTESAGAAGSPFGPWNAAVSTDGSSVFWTSGNALSEVPIYLYRHGVSVEVTASQCTTASHCTEGAGAGYFDIASPDGSRALFVSKHELTNGSNTGNANQGSDLYSFEASTGVLTDLTPDPAAENGANVLGVVGMSPDASVVYFVATGALTSGSNAEGGEPTVGADNLYVREGADMRFIATLGSSDIGDWRPTEAVAERSSRAQVSSDGQHLLFTSSVPLKPGYESGSHSEVYLYDAATQHLTCVSCNPSGGPATGNAVPARHVGAPFELGNNAAMLVTYQNMSSNGSRAFFETTEALLPKQDVNGVSDVYEWEQEGEGTCRAGQSSGCIFLISSGRDESPTYFMGASENGNNVFFRTRQQLVGQDTDENVDLYDARVGGGFTAPRPVSGSCASEASCVGGPASTSPLPVVGSELVSGAGNLAPAVEVNGKHAKPKRRRLTRRHKLERALRQCAKKPPRRRGACRAHARGRFGGHAAHASPHKHSARTAGSTTGRSGR